MLTKKNFFYYLLPSLIAGVLGILLVPITTFYLGPKDFGIFAILSAFAVPLSALASTGSSWVLGAHFYKVAEEDRKGLIFNVLFFDLGSKIFWLILALVIAPILLPLLVHEYDPSYLSLFRLVLFSMLLSSVTATISYCFVYQKRAAVHSLVEITGPLANAAASIFLLAVLKFKTETLFIAPLVAEIVSFIIAACFIWPYLKVYVERKWFSQIIKVGLPSMPSEVAGLLNGIVDRFFIQRWFNLNALGIYAHSSNYRSIFNLGFKAFNRTYAPHALEQFSTVEKPVELKTTLKRWFGLTGIGGVFIVLFSYEIVNLLTHGKFIAAAPLVPLWYTLILLTAYGTTYLQYLFVHKKNAYLSLSGIIISLSSIGLMAFGVFYGGIMGAVGAAVISNFATQLSFVIYARKLGCNAVGDKDFFYLIIFLAGLYLLSTNIAISLALKILLFPVLSIIIIISYDLVSPIKSFAQSVKRSLQISKNL